jgi:hypothetical protein
MKRPQRSPNPAVPHAALALACLVQAAHFVEHIVQVTQIYAYQVPPTAAHGLFGAVFDTEWVHVNYNLGLQLTLVAVWLIYRQLHGARTPRAGLRALAGLVVFQGYHSVEHVVKLWQYLFVPAYQGGLVPTPGLLPQATMWPIFLLHFWLNAAVLAGMLAALWLLGRAPASKRVPAAA